MEQVAKTLKSNYDIIAEAQGIADVKLGHSYFNICSKTELWCCQWRWGVKGAFSRGVSKIFDKIIVNLIILNLY